MGRVRFGLSVAVSGAAGAVVGWVIGCCVGQRVVYAASSAGAMHVIDLRAMLPGLLITVLSTGLGLAAGVALPLVVRGHRRGQADGADRVAAPRQ